jgi:hypothetical protein
MTLEAQAGDNWNRVWDGVEYYPSTAGDIEPPVYMMTQNSQVYIVVNFDQNYFYKLQSEYGDDLTAKNVHITMRVAFRDVDDNVIEALSTSTFSVEIVGSGKDSLCKAAKLEVISGAKDISLSFSDTEIKEIELDNVFKVQMIDGDAANCLIEYNLYTQSPSDDKWYSLDAMFQKLLTQTGSYVNIWAFIEQNYLSDGTPELNFRAQFTATDVENIREFYRVSGISQMNFRIVASIAGSETDSAIAGFDNLKSADFSVKFVEQSQVDACKGNFLTFEQGTWYDGNDRDN